MVKNNPPMGFNTWNTFGEHIDEKMLFEITDRFIELGLKDYGYEYIVIDDCWAMRVRDENGRLVADPEKFPHGMKYVADYVHSKGLKFGMYTCVGTMTCAQYPGSFGYEYIDAKTFADWGVDFLKCDYCFQPLTLKGEDLYRRMGLALANCGRDILFSACSWGIHETHKWIGTTGASMWRSTGDIVDSWESIKTLIAQQMDILPYGGKCNFNDMDMLVVGMHGKGLVGVKGCTEAEYNTHFGAWCMLSSPLMIGCDLRTIDEFSEKLLKNKILIDINQDPLCAKCFDLWPWDKNRLLLLKHLANGDMALAYINLNDDKIDFWATFDMLGIPENSGKEIEMTDAFTGEVSRPKNQTIREIVDGHACKIWRLKVVDKQ